MSRRTLLQRVEPNLHRALDAEFAMPGRARILGVRESVRKLSARITGAGRREFPTAESWAFIVVELDRMLKDRNCPPEVRGELDLAQRTAATRLKGLVSGRRDQGEVNSDPVKYAKRLLKTAQKGARGRPRVYHGDGRGKATHEMRGTIDADGARVSTTLHPIQRGKKQPRRTEDVLNRALPFRTGGPPQHVNANDLEVEALRSGRGGRAYGS